MTVQILSTISAAWRVLVILIGAGHALVGVALLADGPGSLIGPVFARSNTIPWWTWGAWALAAGVLVVWRRTSLPGLALTAGWYVAWSTLLVLGLTAAGGPFYAIPIYLLLAAVHLLVAYVEWATRPVMRPVTRAVRRG